MKTVLVTGGSGWLGGAIVRRLLANGDSVISADVVVRPDLAARAESGARLVNETVDLSQAAQVAALFARHRPDAVVHAAAIVGVVNCADAPHAAISVNVTGMLNVLEAMRQHGPRRMIHVSTEETYGDFTAARIDEDHPQRPVSIYGLTKLAAEHLGNVYTRDHGLDCIHVRTCWVYGPDLPRRRMPETYIDAALDGVPLHHASGGDLAVDQVYIEDTVTGVVLALEASDPAHSAYNIATGAAPTLADVAAEVERNVPGSSVRIAPGPYRHGDRIATAGKGALDIARAGADLGYAPAWPIARGIAELVRLKRAARAR